ncbi:NfeD family protein [Bergeyella porcorum]|uniref:NfeD family protein n=1 Tax=Bergeyella porcorum TaxID=1735111 RepID=UPI0035E5AFB0
MFHFLESLDILHQSFWYIALGSSLIFLIQTILTFVGSGDSDGIAADFDGGLDEAEGPFQLFSFRNLINFLLGFAWTGVAFYENIENKMLLILLATVVGIGFVLLFLVLIKQILKLTEDNTFDIQKLVGKTGEVYLRVPANLSGKGKVQISLNGTNRELPAMTRSQDGIPSGNLVKVIAVEDGILVVE